MEGGRGKVGKWKKGRVKGAEESWREGWRRDTKGRKRGKDWNRREGERGGMGEKARKYKG